MDVTPAIKFVSTVARLGAFILRHKERGWSNLRPLWTNAFMEIVIWHWQRVKTEGTEITIALGCLSVFLRPYVQPFNRQVSCLGALILWQ